MLPSTMPHRISLVVGRTMSFTSETIWPSDLVVVVVVVVLLSLSVREDFTSESILSPTVVVRFFTSSSTA